MSEKGNVMMKKTIKGRSVEAISKDDKMVKLGAKAKKDTTPEPTGPRQLSRKEADKFDFPVGTKFMLSSTDNIPAIFTVRKAYFEMNTHMRQVHGDDGLEIIMLRSLQKDASGDPQFRLI
jgi:hypothetical protein